MKIQSSNNLAKLIRIDVLNMAYKSKTSHIGSALSMVDILAVLYGRKILSYDASDAKWHHRDRLILSKGHACSALYATLSNLGYFSRDTLNNYSKDGSILLAHASHKVKGVEFSTGSLGHGLSYGAGLALSAKRKEKNWNTYVICSDGEMNEGSNWEAIMFASHQKLDNLSLIIDYNKLQSLDTVANTLNIEPITAKFKAFGWHTININGHKHKDLEKSFLKFKKNKGKPTCIIANTIKGKGVSFMENKILWHYKSPSSNEYQDALKELTI